MIRINLPRFSQVRFSYDFYIPMKPKTMKKLLALPEAQQEKLWKQAMDRLRIKAEQKREPPAKSVQSMRIK